MSKQFQKILGISLLTVPSVLGMYYSVYYWKMTEVLGITNNWAFVVGGIAYVAGVITILTIEEEHDV